MPRYDFTIKAGATAPPFKIELKDENNSTVSISGAKNAKFSMRKHDNIASVISSNVDATITDSVAGELQHGWLVADTSGYDNTEVEAEFLITLSDNTIYKIPPEGYYLGRIGDAIS